MVSSDNLPCFGRQQHVTGVILLATPTRCDRIFVVVKTTDHSIATVEAHNDLSLGINDRRIGNDAVR